MFSQKGPFCLSRKVANRAEGGALGGIALTILKLMHLRQPEAVTKTCLILE
jgi:bisphosphoglycerate-independent phosphoglycerate mutase (AlkP superfamily)